MCAYDVIVCVPVCVCVDRSLLVYACEDRNESSSALTTLPRVLCLGVVFLGLPTGLLRYLSTNTIRDAVIPQAELRSQLTNWLLAPRLSSSEPETFSPKSAEKNNKAPEQKWEPSLRTTTQFLTQDVQFHLVDDPDF